MFPVFFSFASCSVCVPVFVTGCGSPLRMLWHCLGRQMHLLLIISSVSRVLKPQFSSHSSPDRSGFQCSNTSGLLYGFCPLKFCVVCSLILLFSLLQVYHFTQPVGLLPATPNPASPSPWLTEWAFISYVTDLSLNPIFAYNSTSYNIRKTSSVLFFIFCFCQNHAIMFCWMGEHVVWQSDHQYQYRFSNIKRLDLDTALVHLTGWIW